MPKLKMLFKNHIQQRIEQTSHALSSLSYNSLILSSGLSHIHFQDDSHPIFKTNPHFAHWCPAKGPYHLLKIVPGRKPLLVFYLPIDFWHAHETLNSPFWEEFFEIIIEHDLDKMWTHMGDLSYAAFIGEDIAFAKAFGIKINCDILIARLNWYRRFKSDYEIFCLSEANKKASIGHNIAKETFLNGGSEYEIHMSYLLAMNELDENLPYQSIVGLNQNAAVLHYHKKQTNIKNGKVLLIDSGACHNHYCSDITRTYASPSCNSLFNDLLNATIEMQKELCELIRPGLNYPLLHDECHIKIGKILKNFDIIKVGNEDELMVFEGVTKTFFPHGLGHMLGIQVHDIGGKQLDEQGQAPSAKFIGSKYRNLRFVGILEENIVVTIEPGIYFIPMLLEKLKNDKTFSKYINWEIVDKLLPFGGIRIEDDVLVTKQGHRNLTREFLN